MSNIIFGDKKMWYAQNLPPEIWREIIAFLEFRDVVKVHHVLKGPPGTAHMR